MKPSSSLQKFVIRSFLLLMTLEGFITIFFVVSGSSESQNSVFLDLSIERLLLTVLLSSLVLTLILMTFLALFSSGWIRNCITFLEHHLLFQNRLATLRFVCLFIFLRIFVFYIFYSLFIAKLGMLPMILDRAQALIIWVILTAVQILVFSQVVFPAESEMRIRTGSLSPAMIRFVLSVFLLSLFLEWGCFVFLKLYPFLFLFPISLVATGILLGLTYLIEKRQDAPWSSTFRSYLIAAVICCCVFILYRLTSIYVGQPNTPSKSYFDLLADAWLQGRLYLENPGSTHDLTFYQDHWYVANPPLVAVLMVPIIWLMNFDRFNTVVFSITFGALNSALLFLLLEWIARRGWIKTTIQHHIWLVIFFAFGSAHYYLAVGGKMWFMSQIVTVTFVLLAVCNAVTRRSVWLTGAAIALAAAARPTVVFIGPLLLGIQIENFREDGKKFSWSGCIRWTLATGTPIFIVGCGLLFYNWLRFGNILDYGYLTENVADFMADDLKNFGTFHPHFILRNLQIMFLQGPKWSSACQGYLPSVQGLSIFLVSPALLWVFGGFQKKPWVLGTWISIIAILIPLTNYYNTGAWQFGYKYLLDFIIPMIILMALAWRKMSQPILLFLIACSIIANTYGVLWWFGLVCRG